jgi:hypothetical protein
MGGEIKPTGATAPVAGSKTQELPPHLLKAMASVGLDPAQVRGAWGKYGMSVDMLPMLLASQGMTGEQVGQKMAAQGVTSADFPAMADFLGVPADQRPGLAALLKLPDPQPVAKADGTTPDKAAPPAAKPAGDAVAITPAVTKSGTASPLTTIFDNPAIKDAIKAQVMDRDPKAITKDRTGLTPEIGLAIGRHPGDINTVGVHLGVGKELGRYQLSGTAAGGTALTLDAVGGLNVMAGSGSGLLQTDLSLRGGIGRAWAIHSNLLHLSLETRVGAYAIAGGVAQAGVLDGGGTASVGARFGGGVQLGPLFVETTRAYTTGGIVDQATAGIRVGF